VSLRTDGAPEDDPRELDETSGLDVVTVAIEDLGDRDFVDRFVQTGIWGTPLYFADAVKRWPQRHVDAVRAVAHARKGGVLVHCGRGHDRTGIVIAILLHLVEVEADEIVADYELSVDAERDETLARLATTTSEALRAFLREPLFTLLGGAGLTREDCDLLRARLVAQ
jgi:hypothetical protein